MQNWVSNNYPDVKFGFYVSRRNNYVHMELDNFLIYKERFDITSDISQLWMKKI